MQQFARFAAVFVLVSICALLTMTSSINGQAAPAKGPLVVKAGLMPGEQDTIWRYYETWQSDVVMVDGKPVYVDVFDGRKKDPAPAAGKPAFQLKEVKQVVGSPFPPADWSSADFDDSTWLRHPGPLINFYRSLALVCVRGKFQVDDPAAAGEMSLSVKFQGGAVAYLNGKEVGRAGLPAGKLEQTTLADAYPHEAFVDAAGQPIVCPTVFPARIQGASEDVKTSYTHKEQETVDHYKSRARSLDVKIPANMLRKGTNVLAIEIHRAAADAIMFTALDLTGGNNTNMIKCWNRACIEQVTLTAGGPSGGIKPNIDRPAGVQVWTEGAMTKLTPGRYADPAESLQPIRLRGLRNGSYSGQAIVGSRQPIKGLSAKASELKGGAGTIPASAIQVCYGGAGGDSLLSVAPETIDARGAGGVTEPVWLIVKVPADAAPGDYKGTLTISAAGEKPVDVPVELKVIGTFTLPNPQDFTPFIGVHESADSVAMQYNVPLWSDEHWKHLDKIYELLGQVGTKDIYLTAVAKTHLANEQSMVRWVKQEGGGHKLDFSIMEKYLDTALKHLGKPPVICLYLHDYGFRLESAKQAPVVPVVTEVDPKTGQVSELKPPEWGSPEARAFWKPVVDGTKEILAKRGLEKSLMFGIASNNWVLGACVQDLKTMYPDIRWVNRTHYYVPNVGDGKNTQPVGLSAVVGGVVSLFYDPQTGGDHVGWKAGGKDTIINFPRFGNVPGAVFSGSLPTYRLFGEAALLSGGARWREVKLCQGVGHIGADYWPVMPNPQGGKQNMGNRYVFWHSLSIAEVIPAILGPGPAGPVSTARHQMMRESLQEAQVRIFVQDALLDKDKAAKLPADLAKRCKELCDERTAELRYYSQFSEPLIQDDYSRVFNQSRWDALSEKLYQTAGEVAKVVK